MRKPHGHDGLKRITHLQTSFQIIRARHEDKVLVKNFPEYADYKKSMVVREEPLSQGIKERLSTCSGDQSATHPAGAPEKQHYPWSKDVGAVPRTAQ